MTDKSLSERMTVDLDIPQTAAERIAQQDRECQCPVCGRLHKHLKAGKPPTMISTPASATQSLSEQAALAEAALENAARAGVKGASEALAAIRAGAEEVQS